MSESQKPEEQLDLDDPEALEKFRQRQRSRSLVLALILVGLCVLFYLITIVKMGVWG